MSTYLKFFVLISGILGLYLNVQAGTTYAVVVGISDYQKFQPSKGDLLFASRDAELFYRYLTDPQGRNVPRENVILLTEEEATKSNILAALEIFAQAKPEDQVIFFFSGHGNSGVFLPYESSGIKPLLTHREIKQAFRNSHARLKLCLVDACKSGTIEIKSLPPSEYKEELSATNVIVFLSSLSDELSVEYGRLGQGVFTYFLLKALRGKADRDQDKAITAFELYQYVSKNVRNYSVKFNFQHKEQHPTMYGKFPKDLPLAEYR
ncbi:caspase family protein (plasmid) [Runella rosea]|uniref:Caspase family protein n=1 Tax=Runella rosea TaxID=2259595 RepID=A0A344TT03_9BACT|nr:caspase family protein [Runella rosea]AXE21774.1 caspase family protein [Runella rosea]